MFFYFGRKARAARTYPAPEYPLVIEPFAGSMAYSLHWRPAQAIGIERDERVVALWKRVCSMTADEIATFDAPAVGQRTYDRWVMQAGTSSGTAQSKYRTMTAYMAQKFEEQRLYAMRHGDYAARTVLYAQGDYRQAPDVEATWFIDPPYQGVKVGYIHGADSIDFDELAEWCMARRGQVIICEGPGSTWLPFEHHQSFQGMLRSARSNAEQVLTRRTHARCRICSVTFPAARADARYCSARCRQRARRADTSISPPAPRRALVRGPRQRP